MSHLFISYKHEDVSLRNILIRKLKKYNIPYWADLDISAGDDWRQAIDEALENAFAVAVILTQKSLVSPYVIYEWSWGLGCGLKVFPLLCEEIPEKDMHPRLSALQLVDCKSEITDEAISEIAQYFQIPSVTTYGEIAINDMFRPLRCYIMLAHWLYEYSDGHKIHPQSAGFNLAIMSVGFEYRFLLDDKLANFWLNEGGRLPRQLKLKAEDLSRHTRSIIQRCYLQPDKDTSHYLDIVTLRNEWTLHIEPILKSLSGYNSLDTIENWLNRIPSGSEQVWEEKTRNMFHMIAVSGLGLIDSTSIWQYDSEINNTFKRVFSHLYEMSSPRMLQELLSENDEIYDDSYFDDEDLHN